MKVSALPADQQLNLTDRVLISDEGGTKTATIQQVMEAITSGSGGDVNLSLGTEPKKISCNVRHISPASSKNYLEASTRVTGYAFGNFFFYHHSEVQDQPLTASKIPDSVTPKLSDLNASWTEAYILCASVRNGVSKYAQYVVNGGDKAVPIGDYCLLANGGNGLISIAAIGIAF